MLIFAAQQQPRIRRQDAHPGKMRRREPGHGWDIAARCISPGAGTGKALLSTQTGRMPRSVTEGDCDGNSAQQVQCNRPMTGRSIACVRGDARKASETNVSGRKKKAKQRFGLSGSEEWFRDRSPVFRFGRAGAFHKGVPVVRSRGLLSMSDLQPLDLGTGHQQRWLLLFGFSEIWASLMIKVIL